MKVIDPGHTYEPQEYDGETTENVIVFMKREGASYPGNTGHHAGTNCQEIIRILINRVQYLNNQIPCEGNSIIISYLRDALWQFEQRAADRHKRTLPQRSRDIENISACSKCGHIHCEH